jgi:hypothetical protein
MFQFKNTFVCDKKVEKNAVYLSMLENSIFKIVVNYLEYELCLESVKSVSVTIFNRLGGVVNECRARIF